MSKELKVGLFVIIAAIIFLATFAYVDQLSGVRVPYKAYFRYAGGVDPGSPVRFGGMKVGMINGAGAQAAAAQTEAVHAVAKVGALGTYLANLRDEATRERYTDFTTTLDAIAREAVRLSPAELNRRTEASDRKFSELNADCIRSAKDLPL